MIETNKKYLLREFYRLCDGGFCKDLLEEHEKIDMRDNNSFYVTGVAQRADDLNGNNRRYPYSILAREVNKYQKLIQEGRSAGELNHPECFSEGFQVLTKDGWKEFKDVKDNEYIFTLNPNTETIELERINEKIERQHKGKMYKISHGEIECVVTPNHKFYLHNRHGVGGFYTIKEVFENRKKFNKFSIPKQNKWDGHPDFREKFVISGVSVNNRIEKNLIDKYSKSLELDVNKFAAFMGIYLAEGWYSKSGFKVNICQKTEHKIEEIEKLLNSIHEELTWNKYVSKENNVVFSVCDARLHNFLKPLGNKYTKYIPYEIKNFPPEALKQLIYWFVLGDGRTTNFNGFCSTDMFSVSKRLIDDLQETLIKSSFAGNINIREPYERMIEGRMIKKENQKDLHILHLSTTKGIYLDDRYFKIEEIDFDGKVYCLSVPNNTFYYRNNGKCFWTGNSVVVNPQNVSHKVVKIWWENKDVMVKLKILTTPMGEIARKLITEGVAVGLSSRGLGSVKETGNSIIVEDDYSLVAFDLVLEPSVQNAFMSLNEVKNHSIFGTFVSTKSNNIKKLLEECLL